jgi:serine/threonine protein kinase
MANGLNHIHLKKFVHRDIKPGNILFKLNEDSNVPITFKISDFGFVKMTSEEGSFSQSEIKGTERYMAPERLQLSKEEGASKSQSQNLPKGSQAADVFAMGCVFYYFCTRGLHPFGESFSIMINIIANKYDISGIYIW